MVFTGIVKEKARLMSVEKLEDFSSIEIETSSDFMRGIKIGASVSIDGVCCQASQLEALGMQVGSLHRKSFQRGTRSAAAISKTIIRKLIDGWSISDSWEEHSDYYSLLKDIRIKDIPYSYLLKGL